MQTQSICGVQSSQLVLACLAHAVGTQCVFGAVVCLCMEVGELEELLKTSGDTILVSWTSLSNLKCISSLIKYNYFSWNCSQ